MNAFAMHTITTRAWSLTESLRQYAAAGVGGVTLWRHDFGELPPEEAGRRIREEGMECTGLARGGFFPAATAAARDAAVEENLRAIDEAAGCGAPVLVLVCGAVPGIPLADARAQIAEGIGRVLGHARAAGVRLAIEPLHPMYADDRSAVVTLGQANDICDSLGSPPEVGVAVDVYHTWWDAALPEEIERAGRAGRLFAFHVCDWKTPTTDLLNDRGVMGEGCIPIAEIRGWMEAAGFRGPREVEIFSSAGWRLDPDVWFRRITGAWHRTCA